MKRWFAPKKRAENTRGGVIFDSLVFLRNAVGEGEYRSCGKKELSGVGDKLCNDFAGRENCTLTALCNILAYYRRQGYSDIPSAEDELYGIIQTEAEKLGYRAESSRGLSVTKNNDLVTNVWRNGLGYPGGRGASRYLWSRKRALSELDRGRPFLFSLASGAYFNHTVAVCGYEVYENVRTGKRYSFLLVRDGWSRQMRYLAWTNTGVRYLACRTVVTGLDNSP